MKLGVNVDHVATLRQARRGQFPDPVAAALICQKAGAYSIVMHLREDRRHIQDHDLFRAKKALSIRLNMEMSVVSQIVDVACDLKPAQCTLVPEKRQEMTTEGGLDLFTNTKKIESAIKRIADKKIEVSLFLDPDPKQIQKAVTYKPYVSAVELHTGDYANQKTMLGRRKEFIKLKQAALMAHGMGLKVHVGHGLDYQNVKPLTNIAILDEFNIGYSIVCDSVWNGLTTSVKKMKKLIS